MQLSKIVLNNIGAYKGVHDLDLTVSPPEKNVVLFGGENGAGKTTLLNSIRIALFGAFAYGFSTENNKYNQHILSLLNNSAVAEGETHFQIILDFTETENLQKNEYRFFRSWALKDGLPRETFTIMRNGQYLTDLEKENYHSKLKETTPPELMKLSLFDGEEISRIVNDNKLSEYLKESARVLFNLNLFESLEVDLNAYLKQTNDDNQLSKDEEELFTLDEQILKLYQSYESSLSEIKEAQLSIEEKEETLENLKKQFDVNGGLIKEEREKLQNQVLEIENIRRQNSEQLKEFTSMKIHIYLNRELLFQAKSQMENEQSVEIHDQLSTKLTTNKLNNVLIQHGVNKENELNNIRDSILSLVSVSNINLIHQSSFSQRSMIESLVNDIKKINIEDYTQLIEENQKLGATTKSLRKQIEINDSTHDFRMMLEQIEDLSKEIAGLQQDILNIELTQDTISSNIEQIEKERDTKKDKLLTNKKQKNAFTIATKVKSLSEKFRSQQLQKKLHHVQIEATSMLNSLMRKKDYVTSIKIDPYTFDVTLYNINHQQVQKERLSSGEKEILLLSIIWAMFKTSKIKIPFIFDTLLGRLDKTHKKTVLSQLIPVCSEQVIILSTDSEIDDFHYDIVKPYISRQYTLDFNISKEAVSIHSRYFHLSEKEGFIQ